jgi:hypothetical protein
MAIVAVALGCFLTVELEKTVRRGFGRGAAPSDD